MKTLLCLLACLLLLACGSKTDDSQSDAATDQTDQAETQVAVADMVVELATRNVSCGCALEDVGKCGN
jgi:hypothetical protein